MFRSAFRATFSPLRATPTVTPRSLAIARRFITQEARQKIQGAIDATPVVLFMKGTPQQPLCGFSRAAIQVLELQGVPSEKLQTFDVLQDSELRSSIKEFSEWPTIPQLYVQGEFVGGCDILLSMHQSGELEELLEKKGVLPPVEQVPSEATQSS